MTVCNIFLACIKPDSYYLWTATVIRTALPECIYLTVLYSHVKTNMMLYSKWFVSGVLSVTFL